MSEPIAIVGDLHLAPRCENATIKNNVVAGQHAFFDFLVKDLTKRGIKKVVFCGDTFTNRQFIAVDALNTAVDLFKNKLKDFSVYVIAGNHDMMYENSDEVTSVSFLSMIENVTVFTNHVGNVKIDDENWYFVPWIIKEKLPKVGDWLGKIAKNREKNVIIGHFEMLGALMEAGQVSSNGFDMSKFYHAAKYTFSGHYHCRSLNEKDGSAIYYVGSPYQLSFAHVGTDCGYYIKDGDSVEFVENAISPRFVECVDDNLDDLPDFSNAFVRYYTRDDRSVEEAVNLKSLVEAKNPIVIKPIPYGVDAGTIDEQRMIDDEEARKMMSLDSIDMAALYLEKFPEKLPVLSTGENAAEKVMSFLREYNEKRS